MVDLCKSNNIKLLLIEIPSAESWSKDLSDKTFELIRFVLRSGSLFNYFGKKIIPTIF